MMAPRRSARLIAVTEQLKGDITPKSTATRGSEAKIRNDSVKKRKGPVKNTIKKSSEPRRLDEPSMNHTLRENVTPPPLDRLVEPHRTNATLVTPRGTSIVAYPPGAESASPSKTGLPHPTATTGNLLEKAVAHLITVEPRLQPFVEKHPCPLFSPGGLAEEINPFQSLVSSIISQQVSGAAAKSIKSKFIALFNTSEPDEELRTTRFPIPSEVAKCDIPTLRTAGLSQRKAEYVQGLAEKFSVGELSTEMLLKASDEEILEKLTAVRGLGKWSVEMFTCFALKRTDVFSTGDLGVQRGCAAFMGRDINKLKGKSSGKFKYMAEKDMLELAAKFSPYRSLFMWYMWRVEDVDVTVLGN